MFRTSSGRFLVPWIATVEVKSSTPPFEKPTKPPTDFPPLLFTVTLILLTALAILLAAIFTA
nr:MAG TPA: hypothetical protein [Caudoviricetes sp.]